MSRQGFEVSREGLGISYLLRGPIFLINVRLEVVVPPLAALLAVAPCNGQVCIRTKRPPQALAPREEEEDDERSSRGG